MTAVKSLWASVQGDPVFMRRVNGWFTVFWIVMIPLSIMFGLLSSVAYVSALSLWALVSGHWSAWQAARVEVAQQAEVEAREQEPVEEKVVDELIARTNIEGSSGAVTAGSSPTLEGRLAELARGLAELERLLVGPAASSATSNGRKPIH